MAKVKKGKYNSQNAMFVDCTTLTTEEFKVLSNMVETERYKNYIVCIGDKLPSDHVKDNMIKSLEGKKAVVAEGVIVGTQAVINRINSCNSLQQLFFVYDDFEMAFTGLQPYKF